MHEARRCAAVSGLLDWMVVRWISNCHTLTLSLSQYTSLTIHDQSWIQSSGVHYRCSLQFDAQDINLFSHMTAHLRNIWRMALTSYCGREYATDNTNECDIASSTHKSLNVKKSQASLVYYLQVADCTVNFISLQNKLWYDAVTSVFNSAQLQARMSVIPDTLGFLLIVHILLKIKLCVCARTCLSVPQLPQFLACLSSLSVQHNGLCKIIPKRM